MATGIITLQTQLVEIPTYKLASLTNMSYYIFIVALIFVNIEVRSSRYICPAGCDRSRRICARAQTNLDL